MPLTKEQIRHIDNYLKHHQVKYWDIRIDLLDHIISSVEDKMAQGCSFDNSLIEVHKSFGNKMTRFWNTGIENSVFANGDGYKKLIAQKRIGINKKCRRLIFKEIVSLSKSVKSLPNLLIFLIMTYSFFFIFEKVSFDNLTRIYLACLFIPAFIAIGYSIYNYIKKNLSIHLEYAMIYLMNPFLIFNMIYQLTRPDGEFFNVTLQTEQIIILISTPIYLFLTYTSFKVYLKIYNEYTNQYKEYLLLCN